MINLAGRADATETVRTEMRRCGIEAVVNPTPPPSEVPTNVEGRLKTALGEIVFRRAWRYWVAKGPVPLELARRMYDLPVGRTDVRVAGHCGCPPPEPPWLSGYGAEATVDLYHIDSELGLYLFAETLRAPPLGGNGGER